MLAAGSAAFTSSWGRRLALMPCPLFGLPKSPRPSVQSHRTRNVSRAYGSLLQCDPCCCIYGRSHWKWSHSKQQVQCHHGVPWLWSPVVNTLDRASRSPMAWVLIFGACWSSIEMALGKPVKKASSLQSSFLEPSQLPDFVGIYVDTFTSPYNHGQFSVCSKRVVHKCFLKPGPWLGWCPSGPPPSFPSPYRYKAGDVIYLLKYSH